MELTEISIVHALPQTSSETSTFSCVKGAPLSFYWVDYVYWNTHTFIAVVATAVICSYLSKSKDKPERDENASDKNESEEGGFSVSTNLFRWLGMIVCESIREEKPSSECDARL